MTKIDFQSQSRTDVYTDLVLTIGNPLLIVLTPWRPRQAWWRDRCGLLYLRHDGVIDWHSDHSPKSTKIASHEFFKQTMKDGWDVFMKSESDLTWCEPDLNPWQYEPDRVLIKAHNTVFKL
jgi:hypothetical protein